MSRIGKRSIQIPEGVTVDINGGSVVVKGLKGELRFVVRPEISVRKEDNTVTSDIKIDTRGSNAYWGTTNAIIRNMIVGVKDGYEKSLELVGVGYRVAQTDPETISLSVGYSNPVLFRAPEGVKILVEDNKKIVISGIDKQLVGLTAARIRKIRKPEPYKGKGIKYVDEVVRRKAGKSAKS